MATLVTDSAKKDLKNKIINMKVIGKLQPHVRLDTSSALFKIYQPSAYMPVWIQRWWAVHNRKTDIARVSQLYEQTLKMADNWDGDEDVKISFLIFISFFLSLFILSSFLVVDDIGFEKFAHQYQTTFF